ncbi:MAG: GNAT family N-acetyltransferase [Saprospiraceae bacterium]|nr:GNAT family N-acetyltransferase [Saprospiraceae bacterium]
MVNGTIMKLPEITTDRMRLRMPIHADLASIFALGNDPEVMRFISYGRTQSISEARVDLKRRIQQSVNGFGYWIAEYKDNSDFIGWIALKPLNKTEDIEIGYRFLKTHWNKGLATEGAKALLDYAFTNHSLQRVVSVAMAANKASTRVMEKLGLTFDHAGKYYDTECVFYTISREKWAEHLTDIKEQ